MVEPGILRSERGPLQELVDPRKPLRIGGVLSLVHSKLLLTLATPPNFQVISRRDSSREIGQVFKAIALIKRTLETPDDPGREDRVLQGRWRAQDLYEFSGVYNLINIEDIDASSPP